MKQKISSLTMVIFAVSMIACGIYMSGCTVAQVTQNPDGTSSTNQVVDPKLEAGIVTAKAVNAATAPVNPYAAVIDWGLGVIAVGASWVAKHKNDKANQSIRLLKTVVQAVDAQDKNEVKESIQAHAVNVGVEGELNSFVKKVGSGLI